MQLNSKQVFLIRSCIGDIIISIASRMKHHNIESSEAHKLTMIILAQTTMSYLDTFGISTKDYFEIYKMMDSNIQRINETNSPKEI